MNIKKKTKLVLKLFGTVLGLSLLAGCSQFSVAQSKKVTTLKAYKTQQLDSVLNEISGLAVTDSYYWGVNDSGGEAVLYGFDQKSAKLSQAISLKDAQNIDWEELAQDDKFIYVADSGNNIALRQSVSIYKVAIKELQLLTSQSSKKNTEKLTQISAEVLSIKYADKDNFLPQKNHNFDSEALTVVDDKLWLFSKNRKDQQSKLYKIDKNAAKQELAPVASYPVHGLITAADYNTLTKQLILLGYSKNAIFGGSFIWVIDVKDDFPLWSSAIRYKLKPYAQWESIKWLGQKQFMIAAENSRLGDQSIAKFNLP